MTSATETTLADYRERLLKLDIAVCEAIAVNQKVSQRLEAPAIGFSTYVFSRVCIHAQAIMCAAPKSRWVRRDFETWDVSTVAAHARSILEGHLLFHYLANAPTDLDTQRAYVNVIHLYDCMKRIKILPFLLSTQSIEALEKQAEEIKQRLEGIRFFSELPSKLKSDLLAGKFLMITPQKELIASLGIDQRQFDFFWNYLSQYTHLLSFSFHRMESNGRGTGCENDFDRGALCLVFELCTSLLTTAVDRLTEIFPDAVDARRGLDSKFSPAPTRNLPRHLKRERKRQSKK
jgi:hypothetical protein